MNTQIYLKLVRQSGPDTSNLVTLCAKLFSPIPLAGVIGGDALLAPFVKWINITGFKNSIGFDSGTVRSVDAQNVLHEATYGKGPTLEPEMPYKVEQDNDWFAPKTSYTRWGKSEESILGTKKSTRRFANYQHLNIDLPDHNNLVFQKNTDNATPQLAFACSSQEPIPLACFFFRRKIGPGIRGIRLPFMCILARDCKIAGWELNGDAETVTLKYKKIQWCTYDQLTDWNVPTGMSARHWNTAGSGGEDWKMYVFMATVGAVVTGTGLGLDLAHAPSPGSSRDSNTEFLE